MSTARTTDMNHREAWEILPWYVNGSLDGEDLDRFEAHVASCGTCRSEVALEERWAREIRTSEELVYSPERSFAELEGRLAAAGSEAGTASSWWGGWRRWMRGKGPARGGPSTTLRWVLAAQAAAILLLAAVVWIEPAPTEFHTVSDAAPAPIVDAAVRVVFEEDVTEAELRALLREVGARIVDGPSRRGVYSLAVDRDRLEAAVTTLRSHRGVLLAEPL